MESWSPSMDFYGQPPKPPSHIEASPDESELWKSLSSSSKGSLIIVEIGITLKKCLLPRATLSYYSEYFQKALSRPWKEAEEGVIRLEDVEISTFNLFVHRMYHEEIPYVLRDTEWEQILYLESKTTSAMTQARLETCIKAYALVDRLISPDFQRHVNDRFVQYYDHQKEYVLSEQYPLIELAFNYIPCNRAILQMLVDKHCTHSFSWMRNANEEGKKERRAIKDYLPHAFLLRTMERSAELAMMPLAEHFELRCYREHEDGRERVNCCAKHMQYDELDDLATFV